MAKMTERERQKKGICIKVNKRKSKENKPKKINNVCQMCFEEEAEKGKKICFECRMACQEQFFESGELIDYF